MNRKDQYASWTNGDMKKIFIPLACTFLVACGSSKEIAKQTSNEQEIVVATAKEVATPVVKKVVDTTVSIVAKTASTMRKSGPSEPQIMTTPEEASQQQISATKKTVQKTVQKKIAKPKKALASKTIDHTPWNTLLQKNVTADGRVNYKGFQKDLPSFKTYLKTISSTTPQSTWSKNQKLAYWMNAYNAYTIKLILDNYPIKSIKDIKKPWDLRFFQIGEKWYNLNEIEHQILRKMGDPRIHFGINCASFSCPPLANKAFTPANVNKELDRLAIAFVNDKKRNEISANEIQISKIFQWFGKDFKSNGSLIDFLNKYAKTKISPTAKKSFKDYNWNLNE